MSNERRVPPASEAVYRAISEIVADAFRVAFSSPTRADLIALANSRRAPQLVIGLFERLPDRHFTYPDELRDQINRLGAVTVHQDDD